MEQVVQVLGALLILAAFVLLQLRVLAADSLGYLVPNVIGAAVLAVDAYAGSQWGFFLLEGVWAVVAAAALVRLLARRTEAAATRFAQPLPADGQAEDRRHDAADDQP